MLHDRFSSLFRAVVPPLALAQTEQHERAHRAHLMQEFGIDELAAVHRVAAEIASLRSSTTRERAASWEAR